MSTLEKTIETQTSTIEMMSNELALLWEQVVYLTQKFYGKSFEKVHFDPNQINLFSEEFVPQEDGDLPSWRNRSHHITSEEGERKAPRGTCSFDGGIFNWCRKQTVLQGSKLGRSIITYALNYEETFKTVLEDGRLVLSNNLAERALKSLVMGRKNCLFSQSFEGSKSSAVIMSLLETAKRHGLNYETSGAW